jgi:hypothetical protein
MSARATILANARHEIAAQERAKGKSDADAYRVAYPKCSKSSAETAGPRLFRKVQVKARVAELQGETAKTAVVSAASIIDELEEARIQARMLGLPAAMVMASYRKAMIAGLISKPQDRGEDWLSGLAKFTDTELTALKEYYEKFGALPPRRFVDAPPTETYEQWEARRQRQLDRYKNSVPSVDDAPSKWER